MMRMLLPRCLFLFALAGCTTEHPFEAALTDEDGWGADIRVERVNYERVWASISRPPSMQIARNISSYRIQYREVSDSSFGLLRDVPSWVVAPRAWYGPDPFWFLSERLFQQNTSYRIRVVTCYHNGTARVSRDTLFSSPTVAGVILRRTHPPTEERWISEFTFSAGYLYYVEEDRMYFPHRFDVYRIDTLTAVAEKMFSEIPDVNSLSISGDTLYGLAYRNGSYVILRYTLPGFSELSALVVNGPPGTDISGIAAAPSVLWTLWEPALDEVIYLVRHDLSTGAAIYTSPPILLPYSHIAGMAISNGEVWIANGDEYKLDNRICRVDPIAGQIVEEHRNPLYMTDGLASDGDYFWVFDREPDAFCKVAVGGM